MVLAARVRRLVAGGAVAHVEPAHQPEPHQQLERPVDAGGADAAAAAVQVVGQVLRGRAAVAIGEGVEHLLARRRRAVAGLPEHVAGVGAPRCCGLRHTLMVPAAARSPTLSGVLGEELTMIAYCDLAGLVRGRSVPAATFEDRLRAGVGWVPANQAINCFGPLAEPNPWGSVGDRRLIPDPATRVRVDLWDAATPLDFVLSDATHTDGSPWEACPRTFLKAALDDLRAETGLRLAASFEHEFVLGGGTGGGPFTLAAQRAAEPFAGDGDGGAPGRRRGSGDDPARVRHRAVGGAGAADRGRRRRRPRRDRARGGARGRAPARPLGDVLAAARPGRDRQRRPRPPQPARRRRPQRALRRRPAPVPCRRSAARSRPACCDTCRRCSRSPRRAAISFLRLTPHHWSAGTAALGYRNRECAVRICPVAEVARRRPLAPVQPRVPGDGRAPPRRTSAWRCWCAPAWPASAPAWRRRRCSTATRPSCRPSELAAFGARPLPADLDAALAAVEEDAFLRGWLPDELWDCYRSLKRAELAEVRGLHAGRGLRALRGGALSRPSADVCSVASSGSSSSP